MPRRVSLQDVAGRAGTSRTTAHYVLTGKDREMRIAEDTRRKVVRAAKELSYRPNLMARGLRTDESGRRTPHEGLDCAAPPAAADAAVEGATGERHLARYSGRR